MCLQTLYVRKGFCILFLTSSFLQEAIHSPRLLSLRSGLGVLHFPPITQCENHLHCKKLAVLPSVNFLRVGAISYVFLYPQLLEQFQCIENTQLNSAGLPNDFKHLITCHSFLLKWMLPYFFNEHFKIMIWIANQSHNQRVATESQIISAFLTGQQSVLRVGGRKGGLTFLKGASVRLSGKWGSQVSTPLSFQVSCFSGLRHRVDFEEENFKMSTESKSIKRRKPRKTPWKCHAICYSRHRDTQ